MGCVAIAVHLVYCIVIRSIEIHHHYWKCLVGFLCAADIVLVKLTSCTNFAGDQIVKSQASYHTDVCSERMDDRSHNFAGHGGLCELSLWVEIRAVSIR